MTSSNYDVVVIGGGCAGMTAAIGLAKADFAVAVVEAAAFPGAENWSGCVYFCENLADPAILGPDGVEQLAWERRLVERGLFASDGHGLLGLTYRDPPAFRNCYTVLRPVFDQHLAQVAAKLGVTLLCHTTAQSLIRDGGRVVGVSTNRGPIYGDLTFLAEGDASHLVSREGYERFADRRAQPKFLHGIKQIIELPPGAVEEIFKLGEQEGAAYELLLRNGTLKGQAVRLNMGGFVYTNKQSLSIGLVLPADNLRDHFGGDPNLLLEWFENLPALKPWLKEGQRGAFGAKLIRGGGIKEVPRLIDDGLAIGGAASGIGIDFPYPNFTGPATAMGLLLTRAACRIRELKGRYSELALRQHYLEPLQKTSYWEDVDFLRHWPGYVKRTTVFFDRQIDLALGSAYVWTRPRQWLPKRWGNWLKLLWDVAGPTHWPELRGDLRQLRRALHIDEVVGRPGAGRLLLDGTINAFRDILRRPRADLPPAGAVQLHYRVGDGQEPIATPPGWMSRWFRRFAPVLAPAARRVYANDGEPLEDKLVGAAGLLARQVNMLDVLGAGLLGLAAGVQSALLAGWSRLTRSLRQRSDLGVLSRYRQAAQHGSDLTTQRAAAARNWDARLGQLAYQTTKESHIQLLWPLDLAKKNAVVQDGLWHVCPAHVYEARVNANGQVQLVVNHENCIKCETCWRVSNLVDWGRDGSHSFIYPVRTPAAVQVAAAAQAAGLARPRQPLGHDWWSAATRELADQLRQERPGQRNGQAGDDLAEIETLLDKLEHKLAEFEQAKGQEPRNLDRRRADHLEMLARYAQQLAGRVLEILRQTALADSAHVSLKTAHQRLLELAHALAARVEEMVRRVWEQHYHWAAADGNQIRQHHLVGLRRFLQVVAKYVGGPAALPDPSRRWLHAEDDAIEIAEQRREWTRRLDAVLPPNLWRDLEHGETLTGEQEALIRDLLARVPALDPANLGGTLHPPLRKFLLSELARRDASLAIRIASHWQARDLARLSASGSGPFMQASQRWSKGEQWASFAVMDAKSTRSGSWQGEALFVPVQHAQALLLLLGDQLVLIDKPRQRAGLTIEPLPTLGLRGAGIGRIRLDGFALPEERLTVDPDRVRRAWSALNGADLTSIAAGMADLLCRRAADHAGSRVQFPGLFWDEQARDAIGKFGVIKKMLAEMAARRYLIDTLDHSLSPVDFSAASADQAGLVKLVVAEALGSAPGSLSYNAGQIFGGTGYSEDDILAKGYRDAAAWRFLQPANVEAACSHGAQLLQSWRGDGHSLAALPGEAENFEHLAQRKALQGELDEIRVARARLRGLMNEWRTAAASAQAQAEVGESLARQDALLLASKALLLRTHARLEHGLPAALEISLLRVWLQGAARSLEEFEAGLRPGSKSEPIPGPASLPATYRAYLAAPAAYDSGDFLRRPADPGQPRYVPELVEADPELAAKDRELRTLIARQFGPLRDGLPFERYIERQHRPDAADLDFCRQHDFFRMMIPKELGGAGRSKADYYLLTSNTQRLADIAITLTIQVNTSIGTTPVLLARDKELPKAQKELASFVNDSASRKDVETLLAELAEVNDTSRQHALQRCQARLDTAILGSNALKALFHPFLESWQAARSASQAFDHDGWRHHLAEARRHWLEAGTRADEYQQELGRRRQACDLFLRWVASGQIAAFALTEPSAGSDTARVGTRAQLRSVAVSRESDGVLHFIPVGGRELRYLLDARRLEFQNDPAVPGGLRACYRWSDAAEPSPIVFDEYDYETDHPKRQRYYLHDGRKVHFSDIAQLRERDGQLWYDYWELTGAKMWITNGRMCGILALYAKTAEGITGFIVDRHAEGLIVGKDEDKLGQCGSPTNELSLQAVRVPRENVIGIEGRGQVNALESLNVGRAGLAMAAASQMPGLIEHSRAFARSSHGEIPDWAAWRLERMEQEQYLAEAVAYEVVGRFEHPQTKSVRMESAIAKMLVSEALQRVIELAEEIHGLAGQTQLHLVEKRKRDARVLNIYEGTNEVQRFLILRELAEAKQAEAPPVGQPASELEMLRLALGQRLEAARAVFGPQLWQNPNLQANCFLLAEAAAWYKAADSVAGRLAWNSRSQESGVRNQETGVGDVGRRALARCVAEVRNRLRRFDEELTQLRRGLYAPEVQAGGLLLDRPEAVEEVPVTASRIGRPLSILVVIEPTLANLPAPQVRDGRLLETCWTLGAGDRSALETALRLRESADAPVSIQVAAVGPRAAAPALREALSLGVERVRLIVPESDAVSADSAAAAIANVLQAGPKFDLVLGGVGAAGSEEGAVARLTAVALGITPVGHAAQLAVQASGSEATATLLAPEGYSRGVALPAAVALLPELALRSFTTESYLVGLAKAVEAERWPKKLEARPVVFAESARSAEIVEAASGVLSPREAANRVLVQLGLRGAATTVKPFEGAIADVGSPTALANAAVVVLAADDQGALDPSAAQTVKAARLLSELEGIDAVVLLLLPPGGEAERRAVAELRAFFRGGIMLLPAEGGPELRGDLLQECWRAASVPIRLAVGEPWTGAAFESLGGPLLPAAVVVSGVRHIDCHGDHAVLGTYRHGGKVRARQVLAAGARVPCFVSLAGELELSDNRSVVAGRLQPFKVGELREGPVWRWRPRLERFYGRDDIRRLLQEVQAEAGITRLADAEFIVDVGFGVGNRDGYEEVIEPLRQALQELGVRRLAIGGSRKVTEELRLLPADRQIGQSGVSVQPRILLAIGVSGAPQHLDYIGAQATIIAFNRDLEAPIMTLNRRRPKPKVFPVIGDLFETVPALTRALRQDAAATALPAITVHK